MLIADWLRIPALKTITDVIDDDQSHDINAIAGRATQTRRYAKEFGIAHVGCCSPAILQDPGAIKAGFLDMDKRTPKNLKGELHANLRWTTIVDRGQLIEVLAATLGKGEAEKQVEEYLKTDKDVIRVSVDPGTHHLYFSGSSMVFKDTVAGLFDVDSLRLNQFETPAFVLTKEPLSPVLQLAPSLTKRSPGPC